MEDKEHRVLLVDLELLTHEVLVLTEKLGVEPDVTRLVYTVNIAKGSGNAEIGGDLAESLVNVPDVLRLRVEGRVVNVLIVHTVFFTTSNADLHLEPDTDLSHTLEVFKADLDVALDRDLTLPKESDMHSRDKYTVFSPHDKNYRKSVHKVPKFTRKSLRVNPRGF